MRHYTINSGLNEDFFRDSLTLFINPGDALSISDYLLNLLKIHLVLNLLTF